MNWRAKSNAKRISPSDDELQEMVSQLIRDNPGHAGGYGAVWFKHGYAVVTDMHGRARYECHHCTGSKGVGPWRAGEHGIAQDWADRDGSDHAYLAGGGD